MKILAFVTAALFVASVTRPADTEPLVLTVRIDNEPITPVTAHFISRALNEAQHRRAQCLVIELNTPGGLMDSTQQIVTEIMNSSTPVIVYVSPSGGRAASAGLFITLASHVAAMAPGTRIGAAHPVQLGGIPITPRQPPSHSDENDGDVSPGSSTAMEDKLVNDTVAWAKSLAQLHGRNAEWAVLAVSESRSITATEAVELKTVEIEASSLMDLLQRLDGREVAVSLRDQQELVRLNTKSAHVETLEMWWGERLLTVISNPNIALLLMMFGVYGILYELYSPGWGIAGTLGVVSLVLAFFGLSVLPINYAGLVLIAIAIALFVAEALVTSYGVLAISGIACLVLGSTMLVDSPGGFWEVSLSVVIPLAVATGLIVVFLVAGVVKSQRSRVQTGSEGLMGMLAVARETFARSGDGFTGQVLIHGEIWNARCLQSVADGDELVVKDRDGLTLLVALRPNSGHSDTKRVPQQEINS